MSSNKIDYMSVDPTKISKTAFDRKAFEKMKDGVKQQISYLESTVKYTYPNGITDDFLIEGPWLHNSGGIYEQKSIEGKVTSQISSKIGNQGEEPQFKVHLDMIREVLGTLLIPDKVQLGLSEYQGDMEKMIPKTLKPIYTAPKDKATNAPIVGASPTIYWPLFKQGYGIMEIKASFTGLDGKVLDWNLLRGVEFEYKPVYCIKSIYWGAHKKIQISLKSCIVKNIKSRATNNTYQQDTLSTLVANNPDIIREYEEQIRKLRQEQEEILKITGNNPNNSKLADGLGLLPPAVVPALQTSNNSPTLLGQQAQQVPQQVPQFQQQAQQVSQQVPQFQQQAQVPQEQQVPQQQQVQQNPQVQQQMQMPQQIPQMPTPNADLQAQLLQMQQMQNQQMQAQMQNQQQAQAQQTPAFPNLGDFMRTVPTVPSIAGLTPSPNPGNTFNPMQFANVQAPAIKLS